MIRTCLALAAVISVSAAAAPAYKATRLGTLGGTGGSANSVNAAGQVTGLAYLPGNASWHAFLYDGTMRDLGTFGGPYSSGNSINSAGQIAGFASFADHSQHAFRYAAGKMTSLGTLGGRDSRGVGINANGDVTGYSGTAGNTASHAFVYANGVMRDIGTLGGVSSQGTAINASGQVTGFSDMPYFVGQGSSQHAFLYSGGVMRDLGVLGGNFSTGNAINDSGQVTGESTTADGKLRAFLVTGNVMRNLGTLGGTVSAGLAINNAGVVVGMSYLANETSHAFVYADGAMRDLNAIVTGLAGTVLSVASAINDKGQIVANGCSTSLICQAFLLDPLPGAVDPPSKVAAVEFRHAGFDHYFLTVDPVEIAALDAGAFAGWTRTGESINVYPSPVAGTATMCRFFSASFGERSSHFYTHDAGECAMVNQDVAWKFEGDVMAIPVPDTAGVCAPGTQRVYRLYNDGRGGAPAHRYTTSLAVRAQMTAAGWIAEGYGPDGVFMCAPI